MMAGCQGDPEHEQKLDELLEKKRADVLMHFGEAGPPVWRRSYPHGDPPRWPKLRHLMAKFPQADHFAVVCARDWFCMAESQTYHRGGVNSAKQAIRNIQLAYIRIFRQLQVNKVPFLVVSYEALLRNPRHSMKMLAKKLDLKTPRAKKVDKKIVDGNQKWVDGKYKQALKEKQSE